MFEFTLSLVALCVVLYGTTWFIRKISEILFPQTLLEHDLWSKLWRESFLPFLPYILGGLFGLLVNMYPYPDLFTSPISHMIFAGFCGAISGEVYRVTKSNIKAKLPADQQNLEDPLK